LPHHDANRLGGPAPVPCGHLVSPPYSFGSRETLDHIDGVLAAVRLELIHACEKFDPMASAHEGYAVILEELDELWELVKGNRGRDFAALGEAVQVAAMSVRYVIDLEPADLSKPESPAPSAHEGDGRCQQPRS
jgi:hypothetical protein